MINHKATEAGAVNIQYLRRRTLRDSRTHKFNKYIKYTLSIRYNVILSFIAKYIHVVAIWTHCALPLEHRVSPDLPRMKPSTYLRLYLKDPTSTTVAKGPASPQKNRARPAYIGTYILTGARELRVYDFLTIAFFYKY